MLKNYHYFIVLAEEKSISKAAARLFISHQCLSKYLANLEDFHQVSFFERSPKLSLTPAGEAFLHMALQIQLLENNLNEQIHHIRQEKKGTLVFGTTDGRYRIIVPYLLAEFKRLYPDVTLITHSGTTEFLIDSVLNNAIDIALLNQRINYHNQLDIRAVSQEQLFLVITDNMLKTYFPDKYPSCIEKFRQGIDLTDFRNVPFVVGPEQFNMRKSLTEHLQSHQIQLNFISEVVQTDLHHMLTARNYAASFCWSMYLPSIYQQNRLQEDNLLYAFPFKDRQTRNRLMLVTKKGRIFREYGTSFIKLLTSTCKQYSESS